MATTAEPTTELPGMPEKVLSTHDTFGTNARVERARAAYRRNPETGTNEQLVACVVIAVQVIVDDEIP